MLDLDCKKSKFRFGPPFVVLARDGAGSGAMVDTLSCGAGEPTEYVLDVLAVIIPLLGGVGGNEPWIDDART